MLLWGFQKQWVAPRITQPKRERILESPNSLVLLMVKLRLNVFFKSRAKTRNEVSSILVQSFLWYIFLFISFRANTRGPRIHNDTEKCLQTEWIFYMFVFLLPQIYVDVTVTLMFLEPFSNLLSTYMNKDHTTKPKPSWSLYSDGVRMKINCLISKVLAW